MARATASANISALLGRPGDSVENGAGGGHGAADRLQGISMYAGLRSRSAVLIASSIIAGAFSGCWIRTAAQVTWRNTSYWAVKSWVPIVWCRMWFSAGSLVLGLDDTMITGSRSA